MDVLINGVKFTPEHKTTVDRGKELHLIFREARKGTGETLQHAADAIGTTKSHLWELEQGYNPGYKLLCEIVCHYGIEPRDIMGNPQALAK